MERCRRYFAYVVCYIGDCVAGVGAFCFTANKEASDYVAAKTNAGYKGSMCVCCAKKVKQHLTCRGRDRTRRVVRGASRLRGNGDR